MVFIDNLITRNENGLYYADNVGIAWQKDRTHSVKYDREYWEKYIEYEGKEIAIRINEGRIKFLKKYCERTFIDIGIGSGEFIKNVWMECGDKYSAFGYDVNPYAIKWLKKNNMWIDIYENENLHVADVITFWDSLEHMPNPYEVLKKIAPASVVLVSIPVFKKLSDIIKSKHYRPNEHFFYFTDTGINCYMSENGFKLLERCDFEIIAGRENIYSYAFIKGERNAKKT